MRIAPAACTVGAIRPNTRSAPMVDSLDIDLETVCFIVFKAREFDAQEEALDEDPASNPSDDGFREILASHSDDQTYDEVKSLIDSLDIDEQSALVALTWVGRGDFTADEWDEARATARERHNNRTAEYLLGIPLLADLLQNGLSELGLSCADYEKEHL
jgi:hypothetical protein